MDNIYEGTLGRYERTTRGRNRSFANEVEVVYVDQHAVVVRNVVHHIKPGYEDYRLIGHSKFKQIFNNYAKVS